MCPLDATDLDGATTVTMPPRSWAVLRSSAGHRSH
jgi:hypothetical protein